MTAHSHNLAQDLSVNSIDQQSTQSEPISVASPLIDWGEKIDVTSFYGRLPELEMLQQWIIQDRCSLVAVLGMGGIGKTALSIKLAQSLIQDFEFVIWRSLRNAPPLETLLADLVPFLSRQQDTQADLSRLMHQLKASRCLIVLDNLETLLQEGSSSGQFRSGYENYGELLRQVSKSQHQSCVLFTSREKPVEVALAERKNQARSLPLSGSELAAQAILDARGLIGSVQQRRELCDRYGNSPLALKIVAPCIRFIFNNEIEAFLAAETGVFNGIRRLLDQQFERLSPLEMTVMNWLAINREWTTLGELQADIIPAVSEEQLIAALKSLDGRSLIEKAQSMLSEKSVSEYTQQPVVMEYVTEQLIKTMTAELQTAELNLFNQYPLLKTTVKEYVRESQVRLIVSAIASQLYALNTELLADAPEAITQQFARLLDQLRNTQNSVSGYGAGNLLNLSQQLHLDVMSYDFSGLTVRQAFLQNINLHQVNFTDTQFNQSIFTQTVSGILSADFSPDGTLVVTGDANGDLCLWQVADGQPLLILSGHTSWARSVQFSPDGQMIASASYDHTVRLWDKDSGACLKVLTHENLVGTVAWSPDGKRLASGGGEQSIRLWDAISGECLQSWQAHTDWVWSIVWSTDGNYLASGSGDNTIKVWNTVTGECLQTLQGHENMVWSIAWSPDGQHLASGSGDNTLKVWDTATGRCLQTLQGHENMVWSIAWSPDGQHLASGSSDRTAKLWDAQTGKCLQTLQGHGNWVYAAIWSPDGRILATGSDDQTIKLWDVSTKRCLRTLQGYAMPIWSAAWSPDGKLLVNGSSDRMIRLWDSQTGKCLKVLAGHENLVCSVAWSPDSTWLASASSDGVVKLWDVQAGVCLKTLESHSNWVWSVAWSPDGNMLASGGIDQTVRLWNVQTGQCEQVIQGAESWVWSVAWSLDGQTVAIGYDNSQIWLWDVHSAECRQVLRGHQGWIGSLAWSPDGCTLASSSADRVVKLWDAESGDCQKTLQAHHQWVWSITWSPNGQILASSSQDGTIKLWNPQTGNCVKTLQGHTNWARQTAWRPDGQVLLSCSGDETMKLWDVQTGECLKTLRSDRPYEGMNITGIKGITDAQKATLKALGAVES